MSPPIGEAWARDATAILLAGGRGTRIASIRPDVPKPMIEIAGRPFVEWVIEQFAAAGVRRFVVSIGHLAEVAERHFDGARANYADRGLTVECVREDEPLGTGGATSFVWDRITRGDRRPVIVANADSLVLADMTPMCAAMAADPAPIAGLLAVRVEDAGRFGSLDIDDASRLVRFREKDPGSEATPGWINAGVYAFQADARDAFPPAGERGSLERDAFPALLARGVHAERVVAPFIDIGTPETLAGAEGWLREHLGRHSETNA